MKRLFCLLLFVCTVSGSFSQEKFPDIFIKDSKKLNYSTFTRGFYLIKSTDIKEFCNSYPVELVKKYKENFYIIRSKENLTLSGAEKTTFYEVNNDWKLPSPLLSDYKNNRLPKKKLKVSVHSINGTLFKYDWISISPRSKINSEYRNNFILEIPSGDFEKLLANPYITHINLYAIPKVETPVVENDISVNRINRVHRLRPDLDGEGLVVSVKELLFNTEDIDFRNRFFLTGIQANEVDPHAALIGTVIGGGGNSSTQGRGVANAVSLTSSSFLRIFPDNEEIFMSNTISVQNHSYGTRIENEYGNEAAAYDLNTNTLPTVLHIFSSGNSGNLTPENGPYAGIPNFANQTGNFKGAKNIITVGAINRDGEIDIRSSKGPAFDGRVKPELVSYAPGGTSDAAALVSGVSILLQQAYQNNNNRLPPSSLVKATLIAGSDDIGPVGIDFESGYGNLNAEQSVNLIDNNQIFEDTITQDESKSFNITIPANIRLLKIALTWNDPAANPGDAIALVNDLDMVITDETTNNWLPWVLNSSPNINAITQPAQRMEDHLNNVEFITIDNPSSGNYTITITGNEITTTNQSFSIAYDLISDDQFQWTFPTAVNPLISGEENILRWDSTLSTSAGLLELNLNNEGWQVLTDQADLNSELFRWPIGDISGNAQLRMTVGGEQYTSEVFAISPELLASVLFNCDDEILLGWDEVPNATAYNVRFLDDRYMEIAQTVTDTTALLIKNDFSESFFSVEPVFDDTIGVPGIAFDFELQGVNCYFRNFFAFLADDTFVTSTLNLSTSINVSQVIFEKTLEGVTQTIGTFTPPFNNDLMLTLDDLEISGGTNTYQATIVLNDGTRIQTETVDIFFPFNNTLILFPNPIRQGDDLNVISSGANQTYEIVELSGRVIASGDILFINDLIEINLLPGFYIFRTIKDGKTVEAKKILVN
ncbi:S8 family serine peptidase [Flavobacteriaceae bacterium R38]|nr:S8 family serine peptidase [Flavobacteriaceae bacterium R38]